MFGVFLAFDMWDVFDVIVVFLEIDLFDVFAVLACLL